MHNRLDPPLPVGHFLHSLFYFELCHEERKEGGVGERIEFCTGVIKQVEQYVGNFRIVPSGGERRGRTKEVNLG